MTIENTAPDDAKLISLDQQIEALEVLVRHNTPGPDAAHLEPYRTYREQRNALIAQRNALSADHHLGSLAEAVWEAEGDWFDQDPPLSKAVVTRQAGAKLREALLEAGWADPGTHLSMTKARDVARGGVAKTRTNATEARNPGSVDQ